MNSLRDLTFPFHASRLLADATLPDKAARERPCEYLCWCIVCPKGLMMEPESLEGQDHAGGSRGLQGHEYSRRWLTRAGAKFLGSDVDAERAGIGTRKARKNTVIPCELVGAEATKRRWGFESLVRKPMAAQPGYSVGAALCVWPGQEGQETSMNYSIYGADRTTHLKVVVVALIAGILVAGFGILMADEGLTARVMKTGKPVMVTTSNKNVKS